MRRDHYVPQFILRYFRKDSRGKVYFAEKAQTGIRLKPIKDLFFQDHGERILATPPKLKQDGAVATLASEPEWTEFAANAIKALEDKWARAIRGLIKWTNSLDANQTSPPKMVIDVQRGPDKQEEWVELVADYCLRTMVRSEETGNELWNRVRESEERDLENLIESQLGTKLPASKKLREVFRQHNRAQTRTGSLLDANHMFHKHNSEVTIGIWRISDESRFIIGSRGGCYVEQGRIRMFLFPITPKVAINLLSRREANQMFGAYIQSVNPRTVIVHNISGRTGISARVVNKAMWLSCESVVGRERYDLEEAMR